MPKKQKKPKAKPRVAFVVQRCGPEVNGGAESLCLQMAQKMSEHWSTEVLTTCAKDYMTWENYFPEGEEICGDTVIRRFPTSKNRDVDAFNDLSGKLLNNQKYCTQAEQKQWMDMQGPKSDALTNFIERNQNDYEAFFFFGYLYATTSDNLHLVAEKAFLVPCAHDEWPIYFSMFDSLYAKPKAFIYNTASEKQFIEERFFHLKLPGNIAGVGIEVPSIGDTEKFLYKFNIQKPYLLYCGRIDPSKGCKEMIEAFLLWKEYESIPHQLVLVGNPAMPIPIHPDIISTGFVTETEKWEAMAACDWLIMPSEYESLSIVLLEAWAIGRPALVNKKTAVLLEHCQKGKGGIAYDSWNHALAVIQEISHLEYSKFGKQGIEYVKENYSWAAICDAYRTLI